MLVYSAEVPGSILENHFSFSYVKMFECEAVAFFSGLPQKNYFCVFCC